MPENFDKIAGIGKAAAVGDLGNALIGIGKLFTGNLDAVIVQIIHSVDFSWVISCLPCILAVD